MATININLPFDTPGYPLPRPAPEWQRRCREMADDRATDAYADSEELPGDISLEDALVIIAKQRHQIEELTETIEATIADSQGCLESLNEKPEQKGEQNAPKKDNRETKESPGGKGTGCCR